MRSSAQVHVEHWLQFHKRPGSRNEPGAARVELLRLLGTCLLEAVKSHSKVVLRMTSADFQYPMKDTLTIVDVT